MLKPKHQSRKHTPLSRLAGYIALSLSICCFSATASADNQQYNKISIIIDDMGDLEDAGMAALALPGAITYAFLPHTPHSESQARIAHKMGKEVMLHLPMQAISSNQLLGPGSLTLDMDRKRFVEVFRADLASIPFAVGVNNHMGSLLTRHPGHMQWLMEEIRQQNNLYFIDSRTTHYTVANRLAHEFEVPSRQRDVFLDDDPDPAAIVFQFKRLIKIAKTHGSAIGIGHPYKTTIRTLNQLLPQLERLHISLVPVSELIIQPPQSQPKIRQAEAAKRLVLNHVPQ